MKIKLELFVVLVVCITSCAIPKDIPQRDDADISLYGSHASITIRNHPSFSGELIEVDSQHITIIPRYPIRYKPDYFNRSNLCLTMPFDKVYKISVVYARDYKTSRGAVILPFLSAVHGYLAIFSFPVNLIGAIAIIASSSYSFHMDEKTMDVNKLKMFARFPGGLPLNVKLEELESCYEKK